MKAMLLAAGRGERMLPLTLSLPKPALPVLGRPIALQLLRALRLQGVAKVVLNLHHLPDAVRRTVDAAEGPAFPGVFYSFEPLLLGTGGGLAKAAPLLRGEGPIVVSNSDFLADCDLTGALDTHRRSGLPATLVLAPERAGYSVVEIDAAGRVLSLAGKPAAPPGDVAGRFMFTGLHVIDESVLEPIPADRPSDIVVDVYRELAAARRLGAHVHRGFWWEFGRPALYLEGSRRLLDLPAERLRAVCAEHDSVHDLDRARAAVGPGVELHESARLGGRVALGFASKVESDAVVHDSVVMPEAWIGPGARLERVVVGPGVEIPAHARLRDVLVCGDPGPSVDGTAMPPGVTRRNGLLLRELGS